MKRLTMFTMAVVMLFLVTFGNAPAENRILEFWGWFQSGSQESYELLKGARFTPQSFIKIEWAIKNARGDEKVNIALMKNGIFKKYLIKNQVCRLQKLSGVVWGQGRFDWKPWLSDVGCDNTLRINTTDNSLSNLSTSFKIYPATEFVKNGKKSDARLDAPLGGETLMLGKVFKIKWTVITAPMRWPSRKIDFLLMANVNGSLTEVGRIHTSYVLFDGCHIFNDYNWNVGELKSLKDPSKKPDGLNGITYRIRLIGDESQYDSDDFSIVKFKVGMKGVLK